MNRLIATAALMYIASMLATAAAQNSSPAPKRAQPHPATVFDTADACLACHNGLSSPSGADVSIGSEWRATMMANSSRDPYWQASVRKEIAAHPGARAEIEDECSVCHMPMARTTAHIAGGRGEVFAHLPVEADASDRARLAHDGVSCTICHQIRPGNLGTSSSFTGGYIIDTEGSPTPPIFGPFNIDAGRSAIMRSSTGFSPTEGAHLQQSELCATCHTLYTTARDFSGKAIGTLPEQMPYFEWRHSSFAATTSCQACHMPVVAEETPISSVLGAPRRLARHMFRGGNFFMLRMLNRYRDELGVEAPSADLDKAAQETIHHLQTETARLGIERADLDRQTLGIVVRVENASGHKLPTGYPSRRSWVHLTVRDVNGAIVFESGAVDLRGAIVGSDADRDPSGFEPHYAEISRQDQVQIYESVMGDMAGAPTTGLLSGVRFLKDNRLLPAGFDKTTAGPDIAVVGDAAQDADFVGGEDRVRYMVDVSSSIGPFRIDAELRFQPIAFRWAQNLADDRSKEAAAFVGYYRSMAPASSEILARATLQTSSRR